MTRGRWIAIAVVILVALLFAAAAPAVLGARATAIVEARTGCATNIGRVGVGLGTVTLETVDLVCDYGHVALDRVEADVNWLELAPTAVRVRGGQSTLTSRPHGPPHREAATGSGADRSSVGLLVSVTDLDVALAVEGGELLHTTLAVEGAGPRWTVTATDTATSADLHPVVAAAEARLIVDLSARTVESLELRGLRVAARAGPSLQDAARAWMDSHSSSPVTSSSETPRAVWEWLREGASIQIADGTIADEHGDALSGLEVEIARLSGSSFRARGTGHPRGSGDMSWDLRLDAVALRVDGPVTLEGVPLSVFIPFLPALPIHDPARALVSAHARVSTGDGGVVDFDGSVGIEGLALESPRIASRPVLGIAFQAEGAGRWFRHDHLLELERGSISTGGARATVAGRVSMSGDRYALDVRAGLPSTPCDVAVHAIPAGFLQDLHAMHLEGRIAASVSLRVDSEHLEDTALQFSVEDRCRFTAIPSMADVTRFAAPFEHEVVEPEDRVFRMETGPGTAAWTPITEVSPFLVHAVLAHEDASFFTHSGFAPWAIRDALVRNLRERRYVLGASTITMQLVKNVFLRREKTLARKVQEVLLTWWIESAMTKAQILELYLNVIEYGPSVYGIRHAAAHYFGRSPGELSVAEAAYLAMILPNPPGFHEHYDTNEVPASFRRRVGGFIGILEHRGRIDAEATAQGREELSVFAFSRGGERVGPDMLRGGSAQLPIDGFSGFPAVAWAEGDAEEPADAETGDDMEASRPDDEGWTELWP